jgi:hypothetical protein
VTTEKNFWGKEKTIDKTHGHQRYNLDKVAHDKRRAYETSNALYDHYAEKRKEEADTRRKLQEEAQKIAAANAKKKEEAVKKDEEVLDKTMSEKEKAPTQPAMKVVHNKKNPVKKAKK